MAARKPWFRLELGMPENQKIEALSDNAFRAYVSAIAYSGRALTDGYLPANVAKRYANGSLDELAACGLFEVAEGGFRIHDYLEYQPSKADVLQLRDDRKAAGSAGGKLSSRAKDKHLLEQTVSKGSSKTQAELRSKNKPLSSSTEANASPQKVARIYEHWRVERRKTHATYERITDERRKKIQTRLKHFSEAELIAAIDGVALDPWADRALNDDITIIFRSDGQVQKFLTMTGTSTAAMTPYEQARAWVTAAGWQIPDADLFDELGRRGLEASERKTLADLAMRLQAQ